MSFWGGIGKGAATALFGPAGYLGAREVEKSKHDHEKDREERKGLKEENTDLKAQVDELNARDDAANDSAADFGLLVSLENGQGGGGDPFNR